MRLVSSVRIGQVPVRAKPAGSPRPGRFPSRCWQCLSTIGLGLLEGVVDGDGKGRMRLLGKAVHRLRHAVKKERFGLLLAAMTIRRRNQFLGLGHGERGKEVRKNGPQRAAQPDIEEVR